MALPVWIGHGQCVKIHTAWIGDSVSFRACEHNAPLNATFFRSVLQFVHEQHCQKVMACNQKFEISKHGQQK